MDCKLMFFGLFVAFGVSVAVGSSGDFVGQNSNGKRSEYLDSNGKYLLEWEAYSDTQTIIFELTVATNGYVGFGISPGGGMARANIIVGGVYANGSAYISNRHGVGNEMPVIDDSETWKLLEASENRTHTYLKVDRPFNTCTSQDVPIGNSTNNFIWSFGQDDEIAYHRDNRGTSANNILDRAMPPLSTTNFQLWRMTKTMVMPTKTTAYWCTVQKSPPLPTKHHIVGFRPVLETPDALKYTHHFVVQKCGPPEGSTDEDTFERFISQPGADCNVGLQNVPQSYCDSFMFVWAVGGKSVTFPEHVGFPFAVDGKPSYFLLEVHLENPINVQGVEFETGIEIFYTSELRQYDAGLITVGHATSWAITIPPNVENYTIVGHCSPSCSSNIPASGINVFNILLHSHLAECTYNSMHANGTIIGGLATTDETCNTFLWYYPEIDLYVCRSEFPIRELMLDFGIESLRQSSPFQDPIVLAPENMANKSYAEVLNTMILWTKENLDHLQERIRYGYHNVVCDITGREIPYTDTIKYPNITKEYAPIDECTRTDTDSSANHQPSLY